METKDAVTLLTGLAQETRLSIFRSLIKAGPEGLSPGDLGKALHVPPATLSFHLRELSHAGLINSRKQGRFIFYMADFARMAALMTYLTENCCQGMPEECLTVMETALGSCCSPPTPKAKAARKPR